VPLYQLKCEKCIEFYEVTMDLATKDKFDNGETSKKCPKCGKKLSPVMCPVRLSSERACFGY
jgi:predicted nucleic acid-binding Zn ribbon protein